MNLMDLKHRLVSMGVRPDAYSLDGGLPSEAYVIAHDYDGWCVYYSERGTKSSLIRFDNESAACHHLLYLIEQDRSTRTPPAQDL
jgi:hypothetical protein